jgi:hypothetical protein
MGPLGGSESKSKLRIQTISRQLVTLKKMIELQFKRGELGEIDPQSNRRTVVDSLQEIHGSFVLSFTY